MADTKISALAELTEVPDDLDELVLVDKSDTSMAASGTDKRVKGGNVLSTAQFLRQSDFTGGVKLAPSTDFVVGDRLGVGAAGSVEIPASATISISAISDGITSRLEVRWTVAPEEFGAKGDGTADDTAAFKAMMQAVEKTNVGAEITLTAGKTYLLNGAPDHSKFGNAIVPLPLRDGALGNPRNYPFPAQCIDVRFRSNGKGSCVIKTTRTGDTYSGSWGSPSIIGGPTPEQVGAPTNSTAGNVIFEGVGFQTPANPAISCVDLWYTQTVKVDGVQISTAQTSIGDALVSSPDNVTVPTNIWTFGIRLPNGASNGTVLVKDVRIHGGPYVGIVMSGSHQQIHAAVQFVNVAYAWPDGCANGTQTVFNYAVLANCKYGFAGWNPTAGVKSMDSPDIAGIAGGNLTMEHTASVGFWEFTAFLLDANNRFLGHLTFAYWGLAFDQTLPTITGGANMNFIRGTVEYLHSSKGLRITAMDNSATPAYITTENSTVLQAILKVHATPTDTKPVFTILGTGILGWGVGGTTATDIGLSRDYANALRVGGLMNSTGGHTGPMFHQRSAMAAGAYVLPASTEYGVPEKLDVGAASVEVPGTSSMTIYNVS